MYTKRFSVKIRKLLITPKFIKSHPAIRDNNAKNRKWNWKIIYALGKMFGGKFPSKLNHIARLLLWKLNKILKSIIYRK